MQCAIVEETEHRRWFRLVGRHHDVQTWDKDPRPLDEFTFDREYDPGFPGTHEKWVIPLFEVTFFQ